VLDIQVSLKSHPGEGTTFALQIPLHRASGRELPAAAVESAGQIHIAGNSEALQGCRKLFEEWNYAVSQDVEGGYAPPDSIVVADAELAAGIAKRCPQAPLVVINGSGQTLPPGAHALPSPVRPAKLRALVGQLQKTLAKSMP
jgi:hypothetical protein